MPVARVRTILTGVAGAPWYSNLYFADDGGTPVGTQAATWVSDFWGDVAAVFNSNVDYAIDPVIPTFQETTGDLVSTVTVSAPTGSGLVATEILPYQTQGLIRLRTSGIVNNRFVRGRIFIPAPTEANSDNGTPNAAYRTACNNAVTALITASVNTLVVWARPFAGDPEAVPPKAARLGSKHVVNTGDTWDQWAVLRSRRD